MDLILKTEIKNIISDQPIIVFIKGSKEQPRCGFSSTVVQIFDSLHADYQTFDVLEDNRIREGIKEYSKWPTIPQVYINNDFIGGTDIIVELYNSKALQELLETISNES
uniref:Glutaredoxin n=1 Tax=Palmaria palmata TaxID=2822 RepID=A0A1C9CH61_PALPL|nr:glutaredoxin [Palmaria palmata]AOM67726.1 glutaredoxin [Palmaria palmata]